MSRLVKLNLPNPHLSASAVELFLRCPAQYAHRYVLRTAPTAKPDERHLRFGKAVHEALEVGFELSRAGRNGCPSRDALHEAYRIAAKKHGAPPRWEAKGLTAMRTFLRRDSYACTVAVEQKFQINIAGVPMLGYIDRVDRRNGSVRVVDYKTGKLPPQRYLNRHDLQMALYALAASTLFDCAPEDVEVVLAFVCAEQWIERAFTVSQIENVKSIIREAAEKITVCMNTNIWPATPQKLCGWCDWNSTCDAYLKSPHA